MGAKRQLATLQEIVDDYRAFHLPVFVDERTFYAGLSRADAIARAARAERPDGKRHDHQRRISKRAIRAVSRAFELAAFKKPKTFAELYCFISSMIGRIKGIGDLFVYDATVRIGANLGVPGPKLVYVHAGVRKGVRATIRTRMAAALYPDDFPAPLASCSAAELEDILCIFGRALERIGFRP